MPESNSSLEKVGKQKVIKQITTGRKKKNFFGSIADSFLGDNTDSVGRYILIDVLIPALKNTILEMLTSGAEMLFYGEPRRNRRDRDRSGRSYVSYGAYYDRDHETTRSPDRNRAKFRFDDIIIDTRPEAEEVLSNLVDVVEDYGAVTIADFYDLVGLNADWSDHKYGWQNLAQAEVQRVREGYVLSLPKPVVLD